MQAQVEQHQRRVGRDRRRRRRHHRRVLVPRLPVGGHRRGSGDIGVDVDLARGAADLLGLEAAAAGTQLNTLKNPHENPHENRHEPKFEKET